MGTESRVSARQLSALFLGCVVSLPLGASEIEQRLERLEAQLKALMERVEGSIEEETVLTTDPPGPTPQATMTAPIAEPSPPPGLANVPMPAATSGDVRLRYFLRDTVMGSEAPAQAPLADGRFALREVLRFDPASYGLARRGQLSRYRDLSLFRSAGVLVKGFVDLPSAGVYEFRVAPKPAREGGGSPVSNAMTLRIHIEGQPLIQMEGVRSWRHQTHRHELPSGRHAFHLWAVSNSPGYGPAPIDSRLEIQVGVPGRAGLVPLSHLVSTAYRSAPE